jgi:cysteine desulfurase
MRATTCNESFDVVLTICCTDTASILRRDAAAVLKRTDFMAIYLDYNAAAPLKPAVRDAMHTGLEVLAAAGRNPSSLHAAGREARALVGSTPAQVIFTSGGTEANALALHGWGGTVLTSAIEHESVLAAAPNAQRVPVTREGVLELGALEQALATATAPVLLSVMLVNNETGVMQPWPEIAALAARYGALTHADAVQAVGKLPVAALAPQAALRTVSAHKIGGPSGVGALIARDHVALHPLWRGGGQEKRRRGGTENVLGIIGFGQAAALAAADVVRQPQLAAMRNAMEAMLLTAVPEAEIAGCTAPRVANTSCLIAPHWASATQLMALDLAGFAVSSGAACSSGKVTPSHVLQAMGYAAGRANQAIRISLGWNTQPEECIALAQSWIKLYHRQTMRTDTQSGGDENR